MDRDEMYMVNKYKCDELKKRLKTVTNWENVKQGTQLFHNQDNNIYNDNRFISYDKETNLVKYARIDYHYEENQEYIMSATGWYYYDECIADEIEEHYTPKLYEINGVLTVAFDKKHALQYIREKYKILYNTKDCICFDNMKQISEVDGFEIKCN